MCLLIIDFYYWRTYDGGMTLSSKNGGYACLIRLGLMLSMLQFQLFQLLQILNDQSIKHLIKLIFYEND